MGITISAGHWKAINSGANGYINEVTEARRVVNRVVEILKQSKIAVNKVEDNTSANQNSNLNYLVKTHNSTTRDIDVSVHFNASSGSQNAGIGTEVLFYSSNGKGMASKISASIAKAGGFKNRGEKYRNNLSFLLKTNKPSILLEVCFVNSLEDAKLYNTNFEKICQAIAKDLAEFIGKKIVSTPVKPTPTPTAPQTSGNFKVESGTYQTQKQAEQARDKAVANKITGEKWTKVFENKNGFYFQTGSYSSLKEAENALQKMKDLGVLWVGTIFKV